MMQKTNKTHWYLLYTNPRAEKKAALELQKKGYEVFLPLQKTLKTWSDRKKWVEEPLFKSYIFIKTELEANYFAILNTSGIAKFISFQSKPAIVDSREIQTVKLLINEPSLLASTIDNMEFELGDEVEILRGAFFGLTGRFIKTKGSQKIMIELKTIHQALVLDIHKNMINKIAIKNVQSYPRISNNKFSVVI